MLPRPPGSLASRLALTLSSRSTQAELAAELVQQLRQGFQEQYLTRELVADVLRCGSPEEAVRALLDRPAPGWEALPRPATS